MPRVSQPSGVSVRRTTDAPGGTQKLINITVSTWHAAFTGTGDVDTTTGFSNPDAATIEREADRVPELELSAGGTPGDYTITGNWNGTFRAVEITTVAGATVKAQANTGGGHPAFDEILSIAGPGPGAGQTLTLNKGDTWIEPPARAIWTGSTAGTLAVQLAGESTTKPVNVPAYRDWPRDVVRVAADDGTAEGSAGLTGPHAVW